MLLRSTGPYVTVIIGTEYTNHQIVCKMKETVVWFRFSSKSTVIYYCAIRRVDFYFLSGHIQRQYRGSSGSVITLTHKLWRFWIQSPTLQTILLILKVTCHLLSKQTHTNTRQREREREMYNFFNKSVCSIL